MSSLPDINGFKDHRLKLVEEKYFSTSSKEVSYDLNKMYKSYSKAYEEQKELVRNDENLNLGKDVVNTSTLLYELFNKDFLRSLDSNSNYKKINEFIGYSKKYRSLTISILDENDNVKSIAIRKAFDKSSNQIKWKTYGSKTYIHSQIKDSIVFLGVGTAEYVLFQLLDVSFINLQSDSMYRHISENLIEEMIGKTLIILKENDESFEKLVPRIKELFHQSRVFVLDFEKALNRKLKHGYDFRDVCNEMKDVAGIIQLIEKEIEKQVKDKK